MTISLKCSECDTSLNVTDTFAGKKCKCPKCATINTVPAGGDGTAEEPSKKEKAAVVTTGKMPKASEEEYDAGNGYPMLILRWCMGALYCGLIGGVVLTVATLIKMIRVIPRLLMGEALPPEVLFLPVAVFLMGFTCGVIVWVMRGLSRRLGLFGDAVIGFVVMNVFFLSCMLLFDPELLNEKRSGGLMMLGLASVTGLIVGPWVGHGLRKEPTQRTNDGVD